MTWHCAQTTRWTRVEGRQSTRRLGPILKEGSCYRCVVSSVRETQKHQKETEGGICVKILR
ncbi:rCG63730 [Rattus norvegicus]|uniref:RCG63730 n=1 Tax=Rattus norvegicus TaxID=10116 RepID=A6I6K3_RAT|nr:rCG63730 [Rattus norvegicus]